MYVTKVGLEVCHGFEYVCFICQKKIMLFYSLVLILKKSQFASFNLKFALR